MAKSSRERKFQTQQKARSHVIRHLKLHPCVDCGEDDILVLDFDHINPSKKLYSISRLISDGSLTKLLKEIAKCEVRCANCHRRKTQIENGSYRLKDWNV